MVGNVKCDQCQVRYLLTEKYPLDLMSRRVLILTKAVSVHQEGRAGMQWEGGCPGLGEARTVSFV